MSARIFPYKTIAGDLRLQVTGIHVDQSDPSPDPIDRDTRQLNLFDQENTTWRTVTMQLELQGPVEEVKKLPNASEIAATAIVLCDTTHQRRAVPMTAAGVDAARWSGIFELERNDFRGSITLEAVVTGTAGGLPNRFLGAATPWVINIDEPSLPTKTGAIEVRWVDFTSKEAPAFLRDYVNEPFYVDLPDLPGEKPAVYLNKSKDFERLPLILDDRRRRTYDLALHNAERTGIARSIWMAMLNAAIAGIREGEDGADPDWPEAVWQSQVLKIVLPRIYRNQSDAEALKTAYGVWQGRQGAGLIESRGQAEINRRIEAAKLLRRTLNILSTSEEAP